VDFPAPPFGFANTAIGMMPPLNWATCCYREPHTLATAIYMGQHSCDMLLHTWFMMV
jgi:hypothetical protein